jgi:hypothetical protein
MNKNFLIRDVFLSLVAIPSTLIWLSLGFKENSRG